MEVAGMRLSDKLYHLLCLWRKNLHMKVMEKTYERLYAATPIFFYFFVFVVGSVLTIISGTVLRPLNHR